MRLLGRSLGLLLAISAPATAAPDPYQPMALETVIPLEHVAGRIDHLAVDLGRQRLFVAEVGNDTLDVVDLASGQVIHRIDKLDDPQGVGYVPGADLILIANGGDGSVRFYHGADFAETGRLALGRDADDVRIDPKTGQALVGYGDGGIAVIDPATRAKLADLKLPDHPEGFQLLPDAGRIIVNVPDSRQITMLDRTGAAPPAVWKTPGLAANFPIAVDAAEKTVATVFRSPARLALLDAGTGAVQATLDTCGDSDDVFFDDQRGRIYVSCGAGAVDLFQRLPTGTALLWRFTTVRGARTSLFVPERDRLYLAVPASDGRPAAIWVLRPS